jgi:hypothetical protein
MALRKDEENENEHCCTFESSGGACSVYKSIKNPIILSKSMLLSTSKLL